jgi:hypothetical protein
MQDKALDLRGNRPADKQTDRSVYCMCMCCTILCYLIQLRLKNNICLKNTVFWDVAPCRSCVNRRFGGTSVHTRSTERHIPEDGILHSHRCENLESYNIYLFT